MKLFEKIIWDKEFEIQICGFPIMQYGKKIRNNKTEKYFDLFPRRSFEKKILKLIVKSTDSKYDHIYLLRVGLGEAFLINFFIKSWCKKNKSINPVFLNPQNEGKCWYSFSQIPMERIKIDWRAMNALKHKEYSLDNKKVFVFIPIDMVRKIGKRYLTYSRPHIESLLEFANLNIKDIKPIEIRFSESVKNKIDAIVHRLDKFIFISKDANSIPLLSSNFWSNLETKIHELGYNIYINSKELNITESVYLASKAHACIALRSGFSEGLCFVNSKIFLLYRPLKNPHIPVNKFLDAYSLKKYPYMNSRNIYEYDAENVDEDALIDDIIAKVKVL